MPHRLLMQWSFFSVQFFGRNEIFGKADFFVLLKVDCYGRTEILSGSGL